MSEVRVKVWRVSRSSDSQYVLILRNHSRQPLPMIIGPCEAMAIWSACGGRDQKSARPGLTHDLLQDLIARLGGRLIKVVIDDLWNGVFYAKLHIAVDGEVVTVDARPSDAVAIALRMQAPLFASEAVLLAANQPDEPTGPGERDPAGGWDLEDF